MLGMLSGLILDSQISASSIRGYDWSPSMARLVSSRSGWFPRIPQAQPGEEWLQVDLGVPKNVKGVVIQGARGGDSITMVEARSFVKKFKVAYSMNGKDWEYIQDTKTMQPKVGSVYRNRTFEDNDIGLDSSTSSLCPTHCPRLPVFLHSGVG